MAGTVISKSNFEESVLRSDIPVLVDFYADWCGPCRMLAPVLEGIAEEYKGKVKVCSVNVDDEPELAGRFNIDSIPALLVFRDGELSATSVGYIPKEQVLQLIGI